MSLIQERKVLLQQQKEWENIKKKRSSQKEQSQVSVEPENQPILEQQLPNQPEENIIREPILESHAKAVDFEDSLKEFYQHQVSRNILDAIDEDESDIQFQDIIQKEDFQIANENNSVNKQNSKDINSDFIDRNNEIGIRNRVTLLESEVRGLKKENSRLNDRLAELEKRINLYFPEE